MWFSKKKLFVEFVVSSICFKGVWCAPEPCSHSVVWESEYLKQSTNVTVLIPADVSFSLASNIHSTISLSCTGSSNPKLIIKHTNRKTTGVNVAQRMLPIKSAIWSGNPYDQHVNCKNVACNLLFIQCEKCNKKFENCCSKKCLEITKLPLKKQKEIRKGKENKKMYYSHKKVNLEL